MTELELKDAQIAWLMQRVANLEANEQRRTKMFEDYRCFVGKLLSILTDDQQAQMGRPAHWHER